jgi:hypothetical protein
MSFFCAAAARILNFVRCVCVELCADMVSGCYMPAPKDRIHTVHAWLLKHLARRATDPSMRSSMHAVVSDAMEAYEQCKCAQNFILNLMTIAIKATKWSPTPFLHQKRDSKSSQKVPQR